MDFEHSATIKTPQAAKRLPIYFFTVRRSISASRSRKL
jgi:hypothetical protein